MQSRSPRAVQVKVASFIYSSSYMTARVVSLPTGRHLPDIKNLISSEPGVAET